MEEGDGLRTRSFRDEDYTTRRLFLRSYPLHFGNDEDDQEAQTHGATIDNDKASKRTTGEFAHGDDHKKETKMMKIKKKKEAMKRIMVTIVEWGGGRVVVLKRFKHKVSFYVVACFPIVFKPSKALISAR
ncbi:hypothetical protein CTI12_AA188790 [Artemisia annua]|uniref:Uncharacterized protein n=1 Tax=Artemisia annua TaxID=35608 RepID=A0A2U1P6C3_ARTAN|nr:hypothetical protein CTI12_AA188790 [Artemisia annua]